MSVIRCYQLGWKPHKREIILLARAIEGKWHVNLMMKVKMFKAEVSAKPISDGGRNMSKSRMAVA